MAQHDYNIANQTFPNTRSDINNALSAVASNNSGTAAPSTTFANQWFYETDTNLLQIRNEDNDAYITIAELDQSNDTVEYFKSDSIRTALIEFTDGDDAITIADGGGCTFGVGVTITTADNTDTLSLISTDADASAGPNLRFYRNSGSPVDDDILGRVDFEGRNSASQDVIYANIQSEIMQEADGSEDGQLQFSVMKAGTLRNILNLDRTIVNVNEDAVDIDFRVKSTGDGNAIRVDAANNRVGFFTSVPDNEVDLKRAANAVMKIESTNNGDDAKLILKKAGSSSRNIVVFQSSNNWHVGHLRNATSTFSIATQDDSGSSNEFRVTTSGVLIAGSLSKTSGSFKIEHPHPDKKDTHNLVHSFVEAPQADNIYRGKVDLIDGSATVNVDTVSGMTDGTFILLNTDTQCFTSNETGWTAIKGSLSGNILTITAEDNSCTDTISWLVVGERHDQHMKDTDWTDDDGKVIVEPLKQTEEGE
tara:strand:- start:116 stop:1549 length:1434 start_codon:yes stop_codon:yes gene_type:complete